MSVSNAVEPKHGHLSDEDFRTMKTSIAEEMARIEETMTSLETEKSSYRDLMQQADRPGSKDCCDPCQNP